MEASSQRSGYQLGQRAWHPLRDDIEILLSTSRHQKTQPLAYGSNYCFLVTLASDGNGESYAIYKPSAGEYPLYDFPDGTLYKREIASYLVDHILGWGMVPPTVSTQGLHGIGSLQLFIDAEDGGEIEMTELRRLALLDIVLNNADRKAAHCLPTAEGKLWAIDHGLTFHAQPKLRTILWHFAGARIPYGDREDLTRLAEALDAGAGTSDQIRALLSPIEWRALSTRVNNLAKSGVFPNPHYKPVPYRW
ncbi:MAG: SCO1664 family protein [Chloroflexota bacterium]